MEDPLQINYNGIYVRILLDIRLTNQYRQKSECLVVAPAVDRESDSTALSKELQSYKKNHEFQEVRHTLRTPM